MFNLYGLEFTDILVERGSASQYEFVLEHPNDDGNYVPTDLTGSVMRLIVGEDDPLSDSNKFQIYLSDTAPFIFLDEYGREYNPNRPAGIFIDVNTVDDPTKLILDAPNGLTTWKPSQSDTKLLPQGSEITYRLWRIVEGGEIVPYFRGRIVGIGPGFPE